MNDARARRAEPAPAPQIQSRPAGPVPFPLGNNQAGPSNIHRGPEPMETLFDTEVAYHANAAPCRVCTRYRSSTINAVVKGPVQICAQTFEGIMDTGASDSAVSHEAPMGILPNFPVRVGNLTICIDVRVTPADNYSILVGNDWLRLAQADLLLSKRLQVWAYIHHMQLMPNTACTM